MSFLMLLTDILYVGHSLVGPALPAMVEAGLARQGVEVSVAAQVINGAPLKYNWDNAATAEGENARIELPKGQTRTLVLTEAVPLSGYLQWNDSAGYVGKFAALAWQARPDTQVYVYETWTSLKSGPGAVIPNDPEGSVPWRDRLTADLALWEGLTAKANAARPEGAPLVRLIPAGQAVGRLADAVAAGEVPGISRIDELFDDDIHPDGRMLTFLALVHVATLSGKSPEGLPAKLTRHWLSRNAVITGEQAAAFQRIAWAAVQAHQVGEAARLSLLAEAAAVPVPTVAPPKAQDSAANQPAANQPAPVTTAPVETVSQTTIISAPPPALSAAPPPTASLPRAITNPRLALGLAGVADWSVQQPFLDVFKTARPWIAEGPGGGGGGGGEALVAGGFLSPEGWPLALPPEATGISTLFLTDLPKDAGGVAGRYVLRHKGKGDLRLEGRAQGIEAAPGQIAFDYAPGDGSVVLTISALDAADPVREISVVRADRADALAAGALFNPDWLNRIRGVRMVRFMDWMATNNSVLATTDQRPLPTDFSYAPHGVPVEVMIALANDLRADAWFTLPHQADDGLARHYATAVRDGLAPGLRAYVEYSNEVWNWQFDQARWADAQAQARWGAKDAWVQYYGLRAAEVADIWAGVFGPDGKDRLVRVIGTQTGWQGLEEAILEAPLVVAEGRKPPADSFDAYAVTGYFAASLGTDAKAPLVRGWLADSRKLAQAQADQQGLTGEAQAAFVARHRFDLATDRAATELENGFVTGQSEDTVVDLLTRTLPYHAGQAQARGLDLVMYEGGTHVVGIGAQVDDPELAAFFQHLNYSPQMGALYQRLQVGWAALTDAPFNAFVDVQAASKWGSWGGLRHLGDENPRWQALATGCGGC